MNQDAGAKQDQSKKARMEFENTIRVLCVSNGFIVKKPEGQVVCKTIPEVFEVVGKFCVTRTKQNGGR